MNWRKIFIIFYFLISNLVYSDMKAYDDKVTIKNENDILKVIHFHDWSEKSLEKRYEMLSGDQNPFSSENDYAYIECIDRISKKTLFKKPSPAFSIINISKDSKFIICLSNIKIYNPYQMVIFNLKGEIILKKHIAPEEAKLSFQEYHKFKKLYPCQNKLLEFLDRITLVRDSVYIDFQSMNMPIWLDEAWKYLSKKNQDSHLSKNFSDSVSNWIFWFKESDPDIKLKYKDKKLFAISLLDPSGKRFSIPLHEQKPKFNNTRKFDKIKY